jgi:hypothetical protein
MDINPFVPKRITKLPSKKWNDFGVLNPARRMEIALRCFSPLSSFKLLHQPFFLALNEVSAHFYKLLDPRSKQLAP